MFCRNRDHRRVASFLSLAAVIVVTSLPVGAGQEPVGTVSGTVVDSAGAAVGNAKITLINDMQGLLRETVTTEDGAFRFPFVLPGTYTVLADMPGFTKVRVVNLVVGASVNSRLDIALKPRGATEIVTVEASEVRVDVTDSSVRYSMTRREVERKPVVGSFSGRTVIDSYSLYLPGLYPGLTGGSHGEGIIVNGARSLSNVFMIDGGDNNDYQQNRSALPLPNPDAVQEVSIVTSNYKADLGGGAGGIFNVLMKAGTDSFHGNLRYLPIDTGLNARDFFSDYQSGYRLNKFGAQVGGPLTLPGLYDGKGRTHFFFDYEGIGISSESAYPETTIPEEFRRGDFSSLPAYDPDRQWSLQQPLDPLTGKPFPGGIIPPERFDPIARTYLERYIPLPELENQYFEKFTRDHVAQRQFISRVDHRLNDSDLLSVTYFSDRYGSRWASSRPIPETGRISDYGNSVVARHTHTVSATKTNQLSGSITVLSRGDQRFYEGFTGVHPEELGFTGIRPQTERYLSPPELTISSGSSYFFDLSKYQPPGIRRVNAEVKDDLIVEKGTHSLKAGGSFRIFLMNVRVPNDNGDFFFSDSNYAGTRNGIADFLIGRPYSYSQSTGSSQYQRQPAFAGYVMDDWRLHPDLTLNLGLRYELTPPVVDLLNQFSVFRPGQRSVRFPNAPAGQLFVGDPDPVFGEVPRGGYGTDWNNLAPRIGIAYSPHPDSGFGRLLLGDGRSVIRASVGLFYNPTSGTTVSGLPYNWPFSGSVALHEAQHRDADSLASFANPWGGRPNPFPITPGDDPPSFASMHTFDPAFRTPCTYHYSLTVQRQLGWSLLLDVGYIGKSSFKLEREQVTNATPSSPLWYLVGEILSQESTGRARYDSFYARVARKIGQLTFDASYSFGKSLDDSTGPASSDSSTTGPLGGGDYFRSGADPYVWARSSFDRRHNFAAVFTYSLPHVARSGFFGLLANGWEVGGLTQLRSGTPLDIWTYALRSGRGLGIRPDLIGPFRRLDPRNVTTFVVNGATVTGHFFFDPTAFAVPAGGLESGENGNLGRNVFDGPGINLTSLSVAKRNRIFKSHELELRADITNLFNHANFTAPQTVMPSNGVGISTYSEGFGIVTSTLGGRAIQLSMKYRF